MEALHVAHLTLIAIWAGLVLAEGVVELSARDEAAMRHAAALHFRMDVLIEAPLLAGIVATGVALAARAWPLTPLHWLKIAAAAVAIAANVACIVHVVRRRACAAAELLRHGRAIRATAAVGVPFGLAAAAIGFACFLR